MKKALLPRFLLGNVEENFMTLVFESLSQMQRFSFQKRLQTAEDYSQKLLFRLKYVYFKVS